MNTLTALLLYPGLLFLLGLAAIQRMLVEPSGGWRGLRLPRPSFEVATSLASVLLASLGLALLPWPLSPLASTELARPQLAWLAFEGAFLLPLLPGLLAPDVLTNRATIREAQIGLAGRAVLWLAAGTLFWSPPVLSAATLIGWALLVAAAALSLPAAAGFGAFAGERALSPSAAEHGLDTATAQLARAARHIRGSALAALVAFAPLPAAQLREPLTLLVWGAALLVLLLMLRRLSGRRPQLTLPSALRWCWLRALPLAAVGVVYLGLVGR